MTKRLDEIQARLAAATPGPWEAALLDDWTDSTTVEGPSFVSGNEFTPDELHLLAGPDDPTDGADFTAPTAAARSDAAAATAAAAAFRLTADTYCSARPVATAAASGQIEAISGTDALKCVSASGTVALTWAAT
jgi:hypothetical protein